MKMGDSKKNKKQLIEELEQLRKRIADFEAAKLDFNKTSDNKRKTDQKYRDLEILNTITQAVHRSLDLDEVCNIALNKTIELDSVDMAFIYMVVGGEEKQAVLHAQRNLPENYVSRAGKIPYPNGTTWKVINSGKIANIENIQNDKNIGPAGRDLGHHSALGIPIISVTGTIGVVWFCSYKEQVFDNKDVELLSSIGNQISIAIAKSKLYDELSKKIHYEEIIKSVTRSVHQSINLQEVLENAVDSIKKNIGSVNDAIIFMVDGKEAVLTAHRGLTEAYIKQVSRVPYPKGATWKTIVEGKMRYCADVDTDDVIGPAGRKTGTKSYLSIPINYNKQTIGCIHLHSLMKNAFNKNEIQLLEIVTQQIEVAVKNAKQAEALRQSEERYRILFDQSPVGVYIFDTDLKVTTCNKSMVEILQ